MHYPVQFEAMTCFFSKDHRILRMKSALLGTISGDDLYLFFFRGHCILRMKSALPRTVSSDDRFVCLEITGFQRYKRLHI